MSASTSETSPVRGNRGKAKVNSGWAAFDLKQRQKHQTLESGNHSEAYPLLSVSTTAPESFFNQNETLLEKPFSSVVVASLNFPSIVDTSTTDRNSRRRVPVISSCLGTAQNMETRDYSIAAYQKLKFLHPCADENLIQDVLSGVDNNVNDALSLLEAMFCSENKDARSKKVESSGNDNVSFDIQGGSIVEKTNVSFTNDYPFTKEPKDDLPLAQLMSVSKYLPIEPEPEWEEDDIYLIHRKDAIRMIRDKGKRLQLLDEENEIEFIESDDHQEDDSRVELDDDDDDDDGGGNTSGFDPFFKPLDTNDPILNSP
ncbi:hypothetical protein OROGR_018959 [Orobanche gracilis]